MAGFAVCPLFCELSVFCDYIRAWLLFWRREGRAILSCRGLGAVCEVAGQVLCVSNNVKGRMVVYVEIIYIPRIVRIVIPCTFIHRYVCSANIEIRCECQERTLPSCKSILRMKQSMNEVQSKLSTVECIATPKHVRVNSPLYGNKKRQIRLAKVVFL